jgi:hypothetical protein
VSVEANTAATEEGAEQESPGFGITMEKEIDEEAKFSGPEAISENLDFIVRRERGYLKERLQRPIIMPEN